MWTPCIRQGIRYTGERKLMFMQTFCIWQGMGYTGDRKLMFMWTPVSDRVYRVTGDRKFMFMWTPCIWQGVQGIEVKENSCLCQCGPPVSGRVYRVYRRKKTHVYVDPLYLAGYVGYTGERKLMFMWTPCIWQGVQGIQVKENSCFCGPPVSGRAYRVYR